MRIFGERQHVFVAMSGGVDSSVAALLLRNKGYRVTGVFMRCVNLDGCADRDAEDARRVAESLAIPFYVWDFEEEYRKRVVEYMIRGYKEGITPNPDVRCNRDIKFGIFFDRALRQGADYIATGHYVRVRRRFVRTGKGLKVMRVLSVARDKEKDQSYFLWALPQERIRRCMFPVGGYLKREVREIASGAGLSVADKKDSQGICFLGKVSMSDFLNSNIPGREGMILDTEGNIVGTHRGAQLYTIGQRHIDPIISAGGSDRKPFYVVGKDVKMNTVTVASGEDNPALFAKELILSETNFMLPVLMKEDVPLRVLARVRYRQPLAPARLLFSGGSWRLGFQHPVKAAAPGQSAVLYTSRGVVIGGGVIAGVC